MPLRDHFRPPVTDRVQWSSFNAVWVVSLVGWLNRTLPHDEYIAQAQLHLGTKIEADVSKFQIEDNHCGHRNGSVLTLPAVAAPVVTIPAIFPDEYEVQIKDRIGNLLLAGAIEIVSPGNKKELNERHAFVAKCVSYLRQGVGLVIIDVVTGRLANFHNELMAAIGGSNPHSLDHGVGTYVAGYRPVHRNSGNEIDIWPYTVMVGDVLPSVPLGLRSGPVVPLDLEGTYCDALKLSGL